MVVDIVGGVSGVGEWQGWNDKSSFERLATLAAVGCAAVVQIDSPNISGLKYEDCN